MADENVSPRCAAGCACCLFVTIFFGVLIGTSLTKLETTESALKYDWWSESIGDEPITDAGMKWVGMGNYLLRFPKTRKYVYFSKRSASSVGEGDRLYGPLPVRTKDGLMIDVEIEFTYSLQQDNLRPLYMFVGDAGWDSVLAHVSAGVIDNWATKFDSEAFYLNRTLVQREFTQQMKRTLEENLWMDLVTLQLLPAHFPKSYSDSIEKTQAWRQDIDVAKQENQTAVIKKNTEYKTAVKLAENIITDARTEAEQIRVNNNVTVTQLKFRQKKDAEGYKKVLEFFVDQDMSTGIKNFITYMKVRVFKDHDDSKKTLRMTSIGD